MKQVEVNKSQFEFMKKALGSAEFSIQSEQEHKEGDIVKITCGGDSFEMKVMRLAGDSLIGVSPIQ